MLIGRKLNFLIIGIIAALFAAIGVFIVIYTPVLMMRTEKDSLFKLDSAVSELRADINKISISAFGSQVEDIYKGKEELERQFNVLNEVKALKTDPEIEEAINIISRLYTLFESNYVRLETEIENLEEGLIEVFLSVSVKLADVSTSRMLERSDRKDEILGSASSIISTVSILDSNLASTHLVVEEQFEKINEVIKQKEFAAYRIGAIVIAVVGILAFLAAFMVASRIVRNITRAGNEIRRMSSGDISKSISIKSSDEMGELGDNLNILTGNLKSAFDSMKRASSEGVLLKEELVSSANQTSAAADEIASNSQAIVNQFESLSGKVSGASDANTKMKSSLLSLEEYVQEQTAMVEESTSSVTEMISSINNVTDITKRKRSATDTLVKTAESGGSKLKATTSVINEITGNLDEIKGTATIIQKIASQTNLLAMNAAIEAAHAGDAGRGFAVVADEIRKLAEASSMNSRQISGVLKEVVSRIEAASKSSVDTEEAFSAIDSEVKGVSQSLDEIAASMEELNTGGKQILEAMTRLQDVSVNVKNGSIDMNESSLEVTGAIDTVARITAEVSGSASEINMGINEVSEAMQQVKELSSKLGDITDQLEAQAAGFTTEAGSEIPEAGDDNAVTISNDDESAYDLEEMEEE
jgi:methyl-accepting chemotaxis protein